MIFRTQGKGMPGPPFKKLLEISVDQGFSTGAVLLPSWGVTGNVDHGLMRPHRKGMLVTYTPKRPLTFEGSEYVRKETFCRHANFTVTERSGGDCCSLWVFSGVPLSCSHGVTVGDRQSKCHSGVTDTHAAFGVFAPLRFLPWSLVENPNSPPSVKTAPVGVPRNGPKAKAALSV